MTYERVVIALCLYSLEQCLNPVFLTSIKTHNFVTFYEFLIHVGVHHTMYDSLGKFMNVNQIAVLFCWVVVLLSIDELSCYHFDNYCAYVVCLVSVLIIAEW